MSFFGKLKSVNENTAEANRMKSEQAPMDSPQTFYLLVFSDAMRKFQSLEALDEAIGHLNLSGKTNGCLSVYRSNGQDELSRVYSFETFSEKEHSDKLYFEIDVDWMKAFMENGFCSTHYLRNFYLRNWQAFPAGFLHHFGCDCPGVPYRLEEHEIRQVLADNTVSALFPHKNLFDRLKGLENPVSTEARLVLDTLSGYATKENFKSAARIMEAMLQSKAFADILGKEHGLYERGCYLSKLPLSEFTLFHNLFAYIFLWKVEEELMDIELGTTISDRPGSKLFSWRVNHEIEKMRQSLGRVSEEFELVPNSLSRMKDGQEKRMRLEQHNRIYRILNTVRERIECQCEKESNKNGVEQFLELNKLSFSFSSSESFFARLTNDELYFFAADIVQSPWFATEPESAQEMVLIVMTELKKRNKALYDDFFLLSRITARLPFLDSISYMFVLAESQVSDKQLELCKAEVEERNKVLDRQLDVAGLNQAETERLKDAKASGWALLDYLSARGNRLKEILSACKPVTVRAVSEQYEALEKWISSDRTQRLSLSDDNKALLHTFRLENILSCEDRFKEAAMEWLENNLPRCIGIGKKLARNGYWFFGWDNPDKPSLSPVDIMNPETVCPGALPLFGASDLHIRPVFVNVQCHVINDINFIMNDFPEAERHEDEPGAYSTILQSFADKRMDGLETLYDNEEMFRTFCGHSLLRDGFGPEIIGYISLKRSMIRCSSIIERHMKNMDLEKIKDRMAEKAARILKK